MDGRIVSAGRHARRVAREAAFTAGAIMIAMVGTFLAATLLFAGWFGWPA